jgi:hypothetical protein
MKSKIALTIALITLAAFGVSSAQAHKSHYNNDYQNNGNDYNYSPTYQYNHFGPHFPWHHRPYVDQTAQDLRDFATRDVAISAPTAIDNSGDVKANTESEAKNNCGDDSSCTAQTTNVIGNGNTVIINNNQDGGSGY